MKVAKVEVEVEVGVYPVESCDGDHQTPGQRTDIAGGHTAVRFNAKWPVTHRPHVAVRCPAAVV